MSGETAKLLQAAGKKWARKRDEAVEAKGKGKMQTCWLAIGSSVDGRLSGGFNFESSGNDSKQADSLTASRKASLTAHPALAQSIARRKSSLNNVISSVSVIKSRASSFALMGTSQLGVNFGRSPANSGTLDHTTARRGSKAAPALAQVSSHTKMVITENAKKTERLVRWNGEVLSRLLKSIEARRTAARDLRKAENESDSDPKTATTENSENSDASEKSARSASSLDSSEDNSAGEFGDEMQTTALEEAKEIINLPAFDAEAAKNQKDPNTFPLEAVVRDQLLAFVSEVASMYR